MKCRRCGADLLDTDTFCVKCGQKVDQPMFCSKCGEKLRDGERFCHKCGSPVEPVEEEEEEIPLSGLHTVDIPFDQIEQGILLEAEQAIVKRPGAEKTERRDPESYMRPGTEMSGGFIQHPGEAFEDRSASSSGRTESYAKTQGGRPEPVRDAGHGKDFEKERYEYPEGPQRRTPSRRYEENDEDYDDDEEDSGDNRMKIITAILGIVVVAIALAIGFILWQRSNPDRYERNDTETEQGEAGEDGDAEEDAGDTQGRIQILSNVNVRTAPTTEGSEVLMVAKKGETYEYYELVDDAWYHIKLEDGGDGYVSKKYVEDLE